MLDETNDPINTKEEFLQTVKVLGEYITKNCDAFSPASRQSVKAVYSVLITEELSLYKDLSKEEKRTVEVCQQKYNDCFGETK
jgi:hypothetical protein